MTLRRKRRDWKKERGARNRKKAEKKKEWCSPPRPSNPPSYALLQAIHATKSPVMGKGEEPTASTSKKTQKNRETRHRCLEQYAQQWRLWIGSQGSTRGTIWVVCDKGCPSTHLSSPLTVSYVVRTTSNFTISSIERLRSLSKYEWTETRPDTRCS